MAKAIHEMSEDEYREFRRTSSPDEFHAAHDAEKKRVKTAERRAQAARLRKAPRVEEMSDAQLAEFYRTSTTAEKVDAAHAATGRANAARRKQKAEETKAAPARKTAPRRVVIKAAAGQSVPIQAARSEGNTVVSGGTARTSGSSSSSQGAKKAAAKKTAAPPRGRATFVNNGATVGVQAESVNGAHVVINANGGGSSTTAPRPQAPAAAAKKTAAAAPPPQDAPAAAAKKAAAKKVVVKKAPAKKTAAAEVPTGVVKPDMAAAVAQVQADQAARLAAEEKARKAAARAALHPGLPEQPQDAVPGQLPKTAAKKVVKKAPARPPMTFAARHRKVRRAMRLVRRKPHVALGLALVFAGTGLFHVAVRSARFGGRKSWAGLKAMGRGYDQYRRMARAAKLAHKHAGCEKCGGTGVITLRASDGSYAGSRSCRR